MCQGFDGVPGVFKVGDAAVGGSGKAAGQVLGGQNDFAAGCQVGGPAAGKEARQQSPIDMLDVSRHRPGDVDKAELPVLAAGNESGGRLPVVRVLEPSEDGQCLGRFDESTVFPAEAPVGGLLP